MKIPVNHINSLIVITQLISVVFFALVNFLQYYYPKIVFLPEIVIGLVVLVLSILITAFGLQRELFYIDPPKFDLITSMNGDTAYTFVVKPFLQGKLEFLLSDVKLTIVSREPNLKVASVKMGARSLALVQATDRRDGEYTTVTSNVTLNSAFTIVLTPLSIASISERHVLIVRICYRKRLFGYLGPTMYFEEVLKKVDGS